MQTQRICSVFPMTTPDVYSQLIEPSVKKLGVNNRMQTSKTKKFKKHKK